MTPNEDFLEGEECVDCTQEQPTPATPCASTTWSLQQEAVCNGIIKPIVPKPIIYCCEPVGIPAIESEVCADCPCYPIGTIVKTLPTKGKLTLLCEDVITNKALAEQVEGLLVYTATEAGTAQDDTFILTKVWSCGQVDVTITISIQDAECDTPVICETCNN